MVEPSALLTVPEVARALRCSTKTIRRMMKRGELLTHRVGRLVRVYADSATRMQTGDHASTRSPVADTPAMNTNSDAPREVALLRQRGKSRVWTAMIDGREVPLGTTDEAEARKILERLAPRGEATRKRPWRVYALPDRAGFAIKYYGVDGVRRTHRIPLDASPPVRSEADAERYASSWYDRHVGAPTARAPVVAIPMTITLEEFGTLWTSGELARQYPDHIRPKKTAADDESRLRLYVYPVIGMEPLARFEGKAGLDFVERVATALPPLSKTFSRASRRHVLQAVHRILVLAAYPARIISANPLPKGFLPRANSKKAKSYVYPSEDAALLRTKQVPLVDRLFFGLLAREGLRVSELLLLHWSDLDLERGVMNLDKNKTNEPRAWALDPGSAEALRRWKEKFAKTQLPNARVFADRDGNEVDRFTAARDLRDSLRAAGVTRPQLFEMNEERLPLRAHDLRATFVTVNLALGRTEAWITDRTGHKSSQMLYRYKRQARTHAELSLGALTPLHEAIPELRDVAV